MHSMVLEMVLSSQYTYKTRRIHSCRQHPASPTEGVGIATSLHWHWNSGRHHQQSLAPLLELGSREHGAIT